VAFARPGKRRTKKGEKGDGLRWMGKVGLTGQKVPVEGAARDGGGG